MPKNNSIKNSAGYVYYRADRDRWICEYKVFDQKKKCDVKKIKTFYTKEDAEEFLNSLQYRRGNEAFIKFNGIPLNELLKQNVQRKLDMNLISEVQYARVLKTIEIIERDSLSRKNIEDITSDDIQVFLNKYKDYSNSYIKKIVEQLNQGYRLALNKGYVTRNPMVDVIKPKSKKQDKVVRALTLEEQQIFTEYLMGKTIDEEPYKNVYLIQMYCGLRVGEALALKATDIDLSNNLLRVNKTLTVDKDLKVVMGNSTKTYAGIREIPIPEFIRESIIEQMKLSKEKEYKDNQLFLSENGKYVDGRNANRLLKKRLFELGIKGITTHSLRHTFGTRCVEAGMRAVALQRLMGHKDVSVTLNTYTSIFNKYKESELQKVNDYYLNNAIFNKEQIEDSNKKMLNELNEQIDKDSEEI